MLTRVLTLLQRSCTSSIIAGHYLHVFRYCMLIVFTCFVYYDNMLHVITYTLYSYKIHGVYQWTLMFLLVHCTVKYDAKSKHIHTMQRVSTTWTLCVLTTTWCWLCVHTLPLYCIDVNLHYYYYNRQKPVYVPILTNPLWNLKHMQVLNVHAPTKELSANFPRTVLQTIQLVWSWLAHSYAVACIVYAR